MSIFADFLIIEPPAAGLHRLRAGFSGHAYDRHRHETYAVGVTETGLQQPAGGRPRGSPQV
jgi:hypothetical protein